MNNYDEIYDSIANGQEEQAFYKMAKNGIDEMPKLMDYFENDLNQPEMAIKAAKIYFNPFHLGYGEE